MMKTFSGQTASDVVCQYMNDLSNLGLTRQQAAAALSQLAEHADQKAMQLRIEQEVLDKNAAPKGCPKAQKVDYPSLVEEFVLGEVRQH